MTQAGMDPAAIKDVIVKLKEDSGPSFARECDIAFAVRGEQSRGHKPPPFTTSMDAALTLVPDGWYWRAGRTTLFQAWAGVHKTHPDHGDRGINEFFFKREHWQRPETTPVIALCIVALEARLAIAERRA